MGDCMHAKLLQSLPTLCNTMDCSLPGSYVHGILQARILEWITMPSSRGSSQPMDGTLSLFRLLHCQVDFLSLSHLGSPKVVSWGQANVPVTW